MRDGLSIARTLTTILGILLCVPAAQADVTIEEVVRVEGAGLTSVANMSTQTTTRRRSTWSSPFSR